MLGALNKCPSSDAWVGSMALLFTMGGCMGRVTGLGGVFFKADDPKRLSAWYEAHLGLKGDDGSVFFRWRERDADAPGMTVWSLFPRDSTYFNPSRAPFMLNY